MSKPTVDPQFLSKVKYRCIGPTRGGRVVAVAGDMHNPGVYYFGACAGGVWKSDDGGQYWQCVTDGYLNTSSIGALAVAPSDSNVIYAGTGESTIRIDVSHGDGVYKSTDAGNSWHHMGLKETRHIGKIRVHPQNPDLVYVAALGHASKENPERGVYRSKDGGKSWEQVLFVSDKAGAVDLSMDPNNPRILYTAVWQAKRTFWSIDSGGPDGGLWRSMDGGDTWENISQNKGLPSGILGKIGVCVSPAKNGRVWAIIEAEKRKRGLFMSDDYGKTWEKVSGKTELMWRPWYYMHVIAHPTDPETVWIMNMDAWKSTDSGKTFTEFTTPHGDNHDLWINPNNPSWMIGSDDGGAWVSWNGGDSWSSIYNQMTAQFYHVAVDDQYPYNVYGTQQDNSSICVPSQTGSGAITWASCYAPGTGESGYIAPHPDDPNIVYVGAIGSSPGGGDCLQKYDKTTGQVQLVTVWPEEGHSGDNAKYRFQWTYPITFDPHNSNTLYATGNRVFRTDDGGQSWEPVSPDLTYADPETLKHSGKPLTHDLAGAEMYATIFSFVISQHQPGVMWAGSDDGLLHLSTNNGEEWHNVTPSDLPKFSQVTMLEQSPHDPATVYMSAARHKMGDYAPYVYKTADYGKTWQKLNNGLPEDDFCRVIREDPDKKGLLYAGLETGLYVSFDDGANWQSLQGNLPVSPVYDLLVKHGDLIVATHGRSFWIMDNVNQLHQITDEVQKANTHLFKPRDAVRTPLPIFADFMGSEAGKSYHVTLGQNATYLEKEVETGHKVRTFLDAGEDPPRGVVINYFLHKKPKDEITLSINDANGNLIETFSSSIPAEKKKRKDRLFITAESGMNSFLWPMEYAKGAKLHGSEFHDPPGGPLAPPGIYSATLKVGDDSFTQPFNLLKDPRVTMSQAEFDKQFEFMLNIRDRSSEMITAVNHIRSIKTQLDGWTSRLKSHDKGANVKKAADSVKARLESIEKELVQVEFKSDGDTLNFPDMLIEKMGMLPAVVGGSDSPPTKQSYEVFDKLSGEAQDQLDALDRIIKHDLAQFNQMLIELGVDIVMV